MREWEKEPDKLEWEHCGFPCLILRHSNMKHLCGYVGLPQWHPFYGKGYEEIESIMGGMKVHGGLTFSEIGKEGSHWKEGYWWIGFDCAHVGDLVPKLYEIIGKAHPKDVYRNIEYVKREVKKLAEWMKVEKVFAILKGGKSG